MKNIFLLIIIFITLSLAYADEKLKISVEIEQYSNMPYTETYATLTFTNSSNANISIVFPNLEDIWFYGNIIVEGGKQYLNNVCTTKHIHVTRAKIPVLTDIPANSSKSFKFSLAGLAGIYDLGLYRVKIIWDTTDNIKAYGSYKIHWESDWINIKFDEITGVDQLFVQEYLNDKYGDRCWLLTNSSNSTKKLFELLQKYLTSFYTGKFLSHANLLSGIIYNKQKILDTFPNLSPKELQKKLPLAHNFNSENYLKYISQKEYQEKIYYTNLYVNLAETYLNSNEDSPFSSYILYDVATIELASANFSKACDLYQKALTLNRWGWDNKQSKPIQERIQRIKEILLFLKQNKICK